MRYGSCKDKKGAKDPRREILRRPLVFGAIDIHARVKMKIIPARSLAKMAAPVSINLFHFALENSFQKGDRTSNAKNANTRR